MNNLWAFNGGGSSWECSWECSSRYRRSDGWHVKRLLIGLVCFLFLPVLTQAAAQTTDQITAQLTVQEKDQQKAVSFFENDRFISLQQSVSYFFDDTHELNATEVVEKRHTLRWQSIQKDSINLFYSDAPLWLSFTVRNTANRPRSMLFEIDWPFLDEIETFRVDSGGAVVSIGAQGDHLQRHERVLDGRSYLFPVTFERDQSINFLMKVSTTSLLLLPIELWDKDAYWKNETATQALLGLFFGLIVVMGIYNFGVWFYTRDISYLYYFLFVVSISLYESAITGYGFQYLWPGSTWLNDKSLVLFAGLSFMSGSLFVNDFLSLKSRNLTVYKIIWFLFYFYAFFVLIGFFVVEVYVVPLGQYAGLLLSVATLALSAHEWNKGNVAARYFTIAWFVLLFGTSIYSLMLTGLLPHNVFTESMQRVGISLEVLLLSFALGDRFNRQRQATEQATEISLHLATALNQTHEEKIRIQESAQAELEAKVLQRTAELEEAKKRLELMSATDQLTGLKNRRYFDDCYASEYKRAFRNKIPLSTMMIDIDHFKRVNDTYGHLVGDECIRRVAQAIHMHSQRPGDVAVRYGGEEFVVLLTHTDFDGASNVAQLIRQEVERIQYRYEGTFVALTVSVGVATEVPNNENGAVALLKTADDLLYQAKQNGRNRVEVA